MTNHKFDMQIQKIPCVLAGPTNAGKTTLVMKIIGKSRPNIKPTIGLEDHTLKLEDAPGKLFCLIDTAGQERFGAFSVQRFHDAKYIFLLFDLSNTQFFSSLENYWMPKIRDNSKDPIIFLIGNKIDLPREVTEEDITKFREKFPEIKFYYEISALRGDNIDKITKNLAATSTNQINDCEAIDLNKTKEESSCC